MIIEPSRSEIKTSQNLEVRVSQIANPNSTAQSENFEFYFYDSANNKIMETDPSVDNSI